MNGYESEQLPAYWLIEALIKRGIALTEIAKISGLPIERLNKDSVFLKFEDYIQLLNWGSERSQDDYLGLDVGKTISLDQFGIFGYLMRHAATLKDICRVAAKYVITLNTAMRIDFVQGKKTSKLVYRIVKTLDADTRHDIDHSLASIVSIFKNQLGPAWTPKKVTFSYMQPGNIEQLDNFFGKQLRFNQSQNAIIFDNDILDVRVKGADSQLFDVLKSHSDQIMTHLGLGPDLLNQVNMIIMRDIGSRNLSVERVAGELNMSRASLFRRLKQHSTSYAQLRDNIVKELARQALEKSNASISEIALMVGYSELSAFVRAFTRQLKCSPSRYRKRFR